MFLADLAQQMTYCGCRSSSWSSHIVPNRPHRAIPLVLSSAGKPDEDWCFESNILLKASFSALLEVFRRYSSNDLCRTKRPASKRSHGVSAARGNANIPAMKPRISLLPVLILVVGAIAIALHAASDQSANYTTRTLALPDHGQGNITMDYIAYDPKTGYVWVPAINVGSVYVVDTGNSSVREISGFATNEVELGGRKRRQGPSGVSIGDGVVYIGDRADSSVCAIDEQTLARKTCTHIDSTPDGVVYVAPTKEVWVTAPRDKSVRILDSQTLAQKEKLTFEGQPEGGWRGYVLRC